MSRPLLTLLVRAAGGLSDAGIAGPAPAQGPRRGSPMLIAFLRRTNLLKQLLDLNQLVHARERGNMPVAAPGVPPSYPDPARLITNDCIHP